MRRNGKEARENVREARLVSRLHVPCIFILVSHIIVSRRSSITSPYLIILVLFLINMGGNMTGAISLPTISWNEAAK